MVWKYYQTEEFLPQLNTLQKYIKKSVLESINDFAMKNVVWNSGVVDSEDSVYVKYSGKKLESSERVYWKVIVSDGEEQAESETVFFEMGLLNLEDWKANWIEPDQSDIQIDEFKPAIYMRKKFMLEKEVLSARIYQTAHGLYTFTINGQEGTEDKFNPGFTSYYTRMQYQTYDISNLLQNGENEWAVTLGDGWWRGVAGGMYRNNFGYKLQFIGQIHITYTDGTNEIICSDDDFEYSDGPMLSNDMKFGEVFDARIAPENWKKVAKAEGDFLEKSVLIPSRSVPCREKEIFTGKAFRDTANNLVIDFGQNIAGYVEFTLRNTKPGQVVSVIHGEQLVDGAFSNSNVCNGISDDTHYQQIDYTAKGLPEETYKPSFSIFGFQYIMIEGYDEEIHDGDFKAIAVYSDLEETGNFTCSNELINKLVQNSRWSQKGNFLDVPTDCPTRERSAWTGDSQVYAKTASRFMNVYPFFEKWLLDVKAEQFPDGMVCNSVPITTGLHNGIESHRLIDNGLTTFVIPAIVGFKGEWKPGNFDGSSGWGDTASISPYMMYLCYGDKKILENQYDTAKRWVDYMIEHAKNDNVDRLSEPEYNTFEFGDKDANYLWDTGFHFGEWLEPMSEETKNPNEQDLSALKTDSVVASAYLSYSSKLVSEMADILGKADDKNFYSEYSRKVAHIYSKYLIAEDGTMIAGHQAPYVRALHFDLCGDKKEFVAQKLVEEVKNNGMKLNTGFLSTPYLLFELLNNGFKEEAFAVLEQTESPSWLYPVIKGATTILESWTGLDEHLHSFNHYSYGAVCDFLFGVVCGIEPMIEKPGYKEFIIKPTIGGSLTNAKAEYESIYGTIVSEWKMVDNQVEYYFEIPVNRGEYALGSVKDKIGAYLLYLDIALNGNSIVDDRVSSHGNDIQANYKVDYRVKGDTLPPYSLLQIAVDIPASADPADFSVTVTFDEDANGGNHPSGLYTINVVNNTGTNVMLTVFLCDNDNNASNLYPFAYQIKYSCGTFKDKVVEYDGVNTFKVCYEFTMQADGQVT